MLENTNVDNILYKSSKTKKLNLSKI